MNRKTKLGRTPSSLAIGALSLLALGSTLQDEAARQAVDPPKGSVRGRVLDERGRPVPHALVVVCTARGGIPLAAERNLEERRLSDDWWTASTAADGTFRFQEVPAGRYRLVAQSWPTPEPPTDPHAVNGLTVHLRGVAEGVEVPGAAAEAVEIRPLGDATFVYARGASNDGWYLFLSTAPPAADPVLGFLGWRGAFLENAIGYARMPAGQVIVHGLPPGRVAYTLFANDSRPGFGAGGFGARDGRLVVHDTNVVAGWSDGIHDPPTHLEGLCEEVRVWLERDGPKAVEDFLVRGREERWAARERRGFHASFAAVDVLGPLEREVVLESGTRATVAELLAAVAYSRLRR